MKVQGQVTGSIVALGQAMHPVEHDFGLLLFNSCNRNEIGPALDLSFNERRKL